MPKSKHRKNHKQKVAARNQRLSEEKKKVEKARKEFILELIKKEQEKGMFENNQSINGPLVSDPIVDGPSIEGPSI